VSVPHTCAACACETCTSLAGESAVGGTVAALGNGLAEYCMTEAGVRAVEELLKHQATSGHEHTCWEPLYFDATSARLGR
jgi:hypothetical protein